MRKTTKKEHYVNNKEFLQAMIDYRKSVNKAKREKHNKPPVPDYIGECFLKIATAWGISAKEEPSRDCDIKRSTPFPTYLRIVSRGNSGRLRSTKVRFTESVMSIRVSTRVPSKS